MLGMCSTLLVLGLFLLLNSLRATLLLKKLALTILSSNTRCLLLKTTDLFFA